LSPALVSIHCFQGLGRIPAVHQYQARDRSRLAMAELLSSRLILAGLLGRNVESPVLIFEKWKAKNRPALPMLRRQKEPLATQSGVTAPLRLPIGRSRSPRCRRRG